MADPLRLGPYEVEAKIGSGGMAEVYLCRKTAVFGVRKLAVVKRIHPSLANQENFINALIDEARIACLLSHPNIVTTFDFGMDGESLYLAMEHIEGADLDNILAHLASKGRRMPISFAVYIVKSILSALAYAHEAIDLKGRPLGIVHRDISPANILLSAKGEIKLTDFGIAKAYSRLATTGFGQIKGKAPYMSPEQAEGGDVDRRSDLFSLGIVFYEMLAGYRPFDASDEFITMRRVRAGKVPPINLLRSEVSESLMDSINKALTKSPENRFQNSKEFIKALTSETSAEPQEIANLVCEYMERSPTPKIRKTTSVLSGAIDIFTKRPDRKITAKQLSIGSAIVIAIIFFALIILFKIGEQSHVRQSVTAANGVILNSKPNGSLAFLDGNYLGHVPLLLPKASKGIEATLKLYKIGFNAISKNINIGEGEAGALGVQMHLSPSVGVIEAFFSEGMVANINGAELKANDRVYMIEGTYLARFLNANKQEIHRSIVAVKPGEVTSLLPPK